MSDASGSTLLTEGAPAAAGGNPGPLSEAPKNGADAALQSVLDGPPEYLPPKFWNAEKKLPDVEGLGRGYMNLEKLLGREKVPVPTGDDDEEGWQRWYAASGRPEKPDDYEFERPTLPDEMPYDEDGEKFLRQFAHQNGLNKKQTKNFYEGYAKLQMERHAAYLEHQKTARSEAQMAFQREHGQRYEMALNNAKSVIQRYGDDDFKRRLDETGLGNDPGMLRMFARIGAEMGGDTKLKGQPTQQVNIADYQKAISEFRGKHEKALSNRDHPDNARLVEELYELYQKKQAAEGR